MPPRSEGWDRQFSMEAHQIEADGGTTIGGRTKVAQKHIKNGTACRHVYPTLRSHIEAMGGQLDIVARFADGAVKIANFNDIGRSEQATV